MRSKLFSFAVGALLSGAAMAQNQVEYEFTNITLDEPDIILSAAGGMFIPGIVGYELSATLDDAFIRNTYFDLRYISTVGARKENSASDLIMNSMSEFKLRAGWGTPQTVNMVHGAQLDERQGFDGAKQTTIYTMLDVNVPTRQAVYYYGLAGQRDMPVTVSGRKFDGKSTYIGGGARWQHYRHYGINVKNFGSYQYQESKAYYAEAFTASSGPYKGISVNLGYENRRSWVTFGAELGATVTGLQKGTEISDTVTGKAVVGIFLDQLHTRQSARYDAKCWQTKQSFDCVTP